MIESQKFNQPFCVSAIAFCFLSISLCLVIATMIMQILNNQLSILGIQNTFYSTGVVQIGSNVCTTNNNYNMMPLSYYKMKFTSHPSILSVTNVTTAITVLCILFSFSFLVVLLVNLRRKTNKCLTQVRCKQIVLGFLALGLVSGTSTTGYLVSFYLQITLLNCTASSNITVYRNTFFIPMLTSAGGMLVMLIVYVTLMFVKVDESKHQYTLANKTTQFPTLEEDYNPNTLNMPMYRPSHNEQFSHQQQDDSDQEKPVRGATISKKDTVPRPPKPEVNLQEVVIQTSKVDDQQVKQSKTQAGIMRARPKIPLQLLPNPKSYPKKQRPPFIPKKQLIRDHKQISIMKQVEYNSINKPSKNTEELVMNDSDILDVKEQEQSGDSHNQSQQIDLNAINSGLQQLVLENKEIEVPIEVPIGVLSHRQPSNLTAHQQLTSVDASNLYVFQRKMKAAHHSRLAQRKTRK